LKRRPSFTSLDVENISVGWAAIFLAICQACFGAEHGCCSNSLRFAKTLS
jgi:hypothetical protein